jgi:glutathione synthase/RimK-type ligase-like ATP-grasp enzyme
MVIEINDNPSIDHGFEDKALGDELYRKIMGYFVKRLEERRAAAR